jgi:hypothetical protein
VQLQVYCISKATPQTVAHLQQGMLRKDRKGNSLCLSLLNKTELHLAAHGKSIGRNPANRLQLDTALHKTTQGTSARAKVLRVRHQMQSKGVGRVRPERCGEQNYDM